MAHIHTYINTYIHEFAMHRMDKHMFMIELDADRFLFY